MDSFPTTNMDTAVPSFYPRYAFLLYFLQRTQNIRMKLERLSKLFRSVSV